jgi:hypothetical protein
MTKAQQELSARAYNILSTLFWVDSFTKPIITKTKTRKFLAKYGHNHLLKIRNCGWLSYTEILRWLNLPAPIKEVKKKTVLFCPYCKQVIKINNLIRKQV